MGMMKIQKGSLNSLKIVSCEVQMKCAQFSIFLILLKKCGKKSDSSLRSREKFTKDFHVKKNYVQFFCKFFFWRSVVNLQGNSFIKYMREIFTKDFHVKNISMKNLSKMNPYQI